MSSCPAPPPAKTVYLVAVGRRLVERHGERPIYTPEDVVAAAEDVIRDWPAYEDIGAVTHDNVDGAEPLIEGLPEGPYRSRRYRMRVYIKQNAEAIRRARVRGVRVDWDCHALSMYCTELAFDAFHAARGEVCDFASMRAEMTAGVAEEKIWPQGSRTGALGSLAALDESDLAGVDGGGDYGGGDYGGGGGSSTWFGDFFDGFGGLFEGWFDDWW